MSLFAKKSNGFYVFIILTGLLNSALNSAFMVVIGKTVANSNFSLVKERDALVFVGLLVSCFVINYLFNSYIIKMSTRIMYAIELDIIQKIRDTSFRNIHHLGSENIYAVMGRLYVLGEAPMKFINMLNPLLTVLMCVGYLFWTAPLYGFMMAALIGVLITSYLWRTKRDVRRYEYVIELQTKYHSYLNDLLVGFKDVKMSSKKIEGIFEDHIVQNRTVSEACITRLKRGEYNNNLVTSYVWYMLLGVVLFVFPKIEQLNWSDTSSFIILLIYIIGPVSMIMNIFPFYSQLRAAVNELNSINTKLSANEFIHTKGDRSGLLPPFSEIRFDDVCFEYFDEKLGKTFSLDPLNISFYTGEVVFIIGGNGSGKSTFLNLLAGLYKPTSGVIFFNEQPVRDELYIEYRNKISAVFFDGYLLNHNYEGFELDEKNEKLIRYLNLMKIPHLLAVKDLFNSKHRLSKGQQKRLALVLALLMDKQLLILDEWASEQDPAFKEYFYRTVVPYLRDEGKTIIAISHDDEYFTCADRVIKFTDGRLVYDHYQSPVTEKQPG